MVKKDGRRVPWDRQKIVEGLERASYKRAVLLEYGEALDTFKPRAVVVRSSAGPRSGPRPADSSRLTRARTAAAELSAVRPTGVRAPSATICTAFG